ncbi:copper resistance CopC/CopD family protein [Thermogemmatispora onikobensis]|uniref:copper resistance CopC/CopD family protein n=1 Tax=Thermogemmatispora onikobensis TaxID=732234 RepID=UPI0008539CAF|nr:copper resistance protein CopC [Thermogemmatispora onikobensis]
MRYGRYGRYPRLALSALFIAGIILLHAWSPLTPAPAVQAHAFVIGSEPIDGSTVATPPRMVRIFFNGPISSASRALVFDPNERVVNATASYIPSGHPRELDTPLQPNLSEGSYLVRWTALAANDGRTTQGAIGFNIGHSSTGLPGQTILGPTTSNYLPTLDLLGILSVAWEWLVLLALTFWVGLLVMEQLVMERRARSLDLLMRARARARPLQWLCLTALLVGEVITLILRSASLSQTSASGGIEWQALRAVLLTTSYGPLWLARLALIALALLWLAVTGRRRTPKGATAGVARVLQRRRGSRFGQLRRQVTQEYRVTKELVTTEEIPPGGSNLPLSPWDTVLWLTLAALYLLAWTLTSDEVQQTSLHISAIVLSWLALLAQAVWFGGLAYLGYVLLPLLAAVEPDHHADLLVTLTRRLTPLLLTAMAVLLVSQLFLAESVFSDLQALLSTAYGRTLLVRQALIALLLALTLFMLFRITPRLARQTLLLPVVDAELPARRTRREALLQTERQLGRLLKAQSWVGMAILLCAALMSFFAPPIAFPQLNYAQAAQNQNQTGQTASPNAPVTAAQQVGDLTVSLLVTPGRVNSPNTVVIVLTDSHGQPVTNARLILAINMVLMDMGTVQQTLNQGQPAYVATFPPRTTFDMAGLWKLELTIERPGQAPLQTTFEFSLS